MSKYSSSSSKSKHIPAYDLNVPGGGPQKKVTVMTDTPIYSSYTGNFVQNGPMQFNVPTDAPFGHANYGKNFHVIEYNPENHTFMTHGLGLGSNISYSSWGF